MGNYSSFFKKMKRIFCCTTQQEPEESIYSENTKTIYSGLPNIGSTCYLNSTIQLLYSMPELRNKLLNKIQDDIDPNSYTSFIGNIFYTISNDKYNRQSKQYLLRGLGNKIQKETHIRYNTQQDLLDCFINLVGSLIEENPELESLMTTASHKLCDCLELHRLVHRQILVKLKQTCQDCKRKMQKSVFEAPQYLVIVPDRKSGLYENQVKLNQGNGDAQEQYEILSVAKYTGNQTYGHYQAFIKDKQYETDKQWIQISDNQLYYKRNKPTDGFLCIYQKTRNDKCVYQKTRNDKAQRVKK